LILHQHASGVIEYVYTITTDNEKHRREMVQAFYGQYFILFKAVDETGTEKMGLKEFLELKPTMAQQVLDKIEGIVQKLVEKGMSRHSLVQAIICEYIQ
jgi:hypothetical protein